MFSIHKQELCFIFLFFSKKKIKKKIYIYQTKISFHPTKPFFVLASQRVVRVYNLVRQKMFKKLQANVKWISSVDVHPGGDNIIVTSYDRRLCWFDLDLVSLCEA